MLKPLIIVESFAKVKTITGFLRGEYQVMASGGHVRDLPEDGLGVDVEAGFEPEYYPLPGKEKTLKKIRDAVKALREPPNGLPVFLATDPDREGEAIAWHLSQALAMADAKRIEFNEITKSAVLSALEHPRPIDMSRVNAQQARRIIDRLVGYELSPKLHKAGDRTLSAGRVQSVALRMICERERAVEAFVPQEYWTIAAVLRPEGSEETLEAELASVAGEKPELGNEEAARKVCAALEHADFRVSGVEVEQENRHPRPPFITSTLQQAAYNRLRLSAYRSMRTAQQLYQGVKLGKEGTVALITYIRTDSVRVSDQASQAARRFVLETFGEEYVPEFPRKYKVKASAQDAHEAIRPTYAGLTPDNLQDKLEKDQWALYDLIWRRFLASQMASALYEKTEVAIAAGNCLFRANGSKLLFPGFLKVEPREEEDKLIPLLREGQKLALVELKPEQHFTEPPPRYNEASLVKALEDNGIGRPSTYAPILQTLRDREYVWTERRSLRPTELGFQVNDYLVKHFPGIINVEFTANMESDLDQVERGRAEWRQLLSDFYQTFKPLEENAVEFRIETKCPKCGRLLALRSGKSGRFYGCTGYPECDYTAPVKPKEPVVIVEGKVCPQCGRPLARRRSRFGFFVGCTGYPECRYIERSQKSAPEPTGKPCPVEGCGGELVRRRGRAGYFLGCSNYPDCRHISVEGKAKPGSVARKATKKSSTATRSSKTRSSRSPS